MDMKIELARIAAEHDVALGLLVEAVFLAGDTVKTLFPRNCRVKPGEGQRSVITGGDELSLSIFVQEMTQRMPNLKILSEEDTNHPAILRKNYPEELFDPLGVGVIFDPVDSTLHYGEDTGGWSVAAGLVKEGELLGTVIYAPAMNDGFVVVCAKGFGVWTLEWGDKLSYFHPGLCEKHRPFGESVMRLGVDTLLYPNFTQIIPEIAANVKGVLTTGSGALGLALLACGRVQAVVQTPQKAWDWATAFVAARETGNVFQFFRISNNGTLIPETHYDFQAFCYLPKSNRLGFVAGQPDLVHKIFSLLPKTDWLRMDPDRVSGGWSK